MKNQESTTPVVAVSFVERALALLNQSEAQIQTQQITDFQEDAVIAVNSTIDVLNGQIATVTSKITRAEREVTTATKKYEVARFSYAATPEAYIQNRVDAKKAVHSASQVVASLTQEKTQLEAKLAEMKEVLADLV